MIKHYKIINEHSDYVKTSFTDFEDSSTSDILNRIIIIFYSSMF